MVWLLLRRRLRRRRQWSRSEQQQQQLVLDALAMLVAAFVLVSVRCVNVSSKASLYTGLL